MTCTQRSGTTGFFFETKLSPLCQHLVVFTSGTLTPTGEFYTLEIQENNSLNFISPILPHILNTFDTIKPIEL